MNDRQAIVDILTSFEIEPRPCDILVSEYFRRNRSFGPKARKHISDSVFTIVRMRRRIDGYLSLSGVKKTSVKERVVMFLKIESGEVDVDLTSSALPPISFPGGLAAFYSFPEFIFDRMKKVYSKDDLVDIANSYNGTAFPVLRVNVSKTSRETLLKTLNNISVEAEPSKYSPFGIKLKKRLALPSMQEFKDGLFEMQDEASQLVSMLAVPNSKGVVLDFCAGAGGKSLAVSAIAGNEVKIVATDVSASKLEVLKDRARRAASKNITTMSMKKVFDSSELKNSFDVVIVDAPCSGTGTLRRSPDIRWRLSESEIFSRAAKQLQILSDAATFVKHGGYLIYATCSFLFEENESVVSAFLKSGKYSVVNVSERFKAFGVPVDHLETSEGYLRTSPCMSNMDGFFAAVLKCI